MQVEIEDLARSTKLQSVLDENGSKVRLKGPWLGGATLESIGSLETFKKYRQTECKWINRFKGTTLKDLVDLYSNLRQEKNWVEADEIRDLIKDLGYIIETSKTGTSMRKEY